MFNRIVAGWIGFQVIVILVTGTTTAQSQSVDELLRETDSVNRLVCKEGSCVVHPPAAEYSDPITVSTQRAG